LITHVKVVELARAILI